jgi:hypothetical protein
MIGVNPPGHFVYDPKVTDAQIGRYADLCAKDEGCSRRTDDLASSMRRTAADIPDRWMFLPIKAGNVRLASFFGLMETTSEAAPISSPMTIDSWLSAAKGDASGFWFMSLMADIAFPESFVWGELAATGIQDAPTAEAYYSAGGDRGSILGNPDTDFIWAKGALAGAWPRNPVDSQYSRVRTSNVDTLLIGGTLDFATPLDGATKELLPHLPNGHQVVLPGFGHATDFWTYQPKASGHLINTFLDSGRVDDSLYTPRTMDFEPGMTQAAIAKIIAGAMVGFALLAVLSLLLMWRRVCNRGRFGRTASAVLRSVYPVVLGLGGWFIGAMIVMTTMPTVPLDSEVLAGLSVGLPIGLGVYLAWVHRDWSAATKTVGFAAAVGGALVGAWLGYNATAGVLALITTVAGAAVGGNLTVLALDIAWDRSARERVAEPLAPPALASARA